MISFTVHVSLKNTYPLSTEHQSATYPEHGVASAAGDAWKIQIVALQAEREEEGSV